MRHFFSRFITALIICTGLWVNSAALHAGIAHYQTEDERLFKAAFIYNFAKFTSWPESVSKQNSNLVLCISGKNELTKKLQQLDGKAVKGQQVSIQQLQNIKSVAHCHMLYIATTEKNHYKKILAAVQGKPILTISDLTGFVQSGGIIQFYREKGKTRLIINLDIALATGLEISSRLLILAKVISKGEPQ